MHFLFQASKRENVDNDDKRVWHDGTVSVHEEEEDNDDDYYEEFI